jgi:hypothetical protein
MPRRIVSTPPPLPRCRGMCPPSRFGTNRRQFLYCQPFDLTSLLRSIRSIHLQHLFRIGYAVCSCISTSRSMRSRATSTEYSVPVYETTDSPLDISLSSYRYQLRNGTSLDSAHVAEDNTRTVSEWWVRK